MTKASLNFYITSHCFVSRYFMPDYADMLFQIQINSYLTEIQFFAQNTYRNMFICP